jgi:hypothetical protein
VSEPAEKAGRNPVAEYKGLLRKVLDNRPSGTRQRLADALAKNRSFITQISNPSYQVPIPRTHLETIFEICHFSHEEKRAFLTLYAQAHPGKLQVVGRKTPMRDLVVQVPDLGSARKNKAIDSLVEEFARHLARTIDEVS